MPFEEKYIALDKLIEAISFFSYEEEDARQLIDFFKKNARIVFSLSEGTPFKKNFFDKDSINQMSFFALNDKDKINFYRIKNVYYLIKHFIYNDNFEIDIVVLFYGNELIFLKREVADIYLNDFFSHNGEINYLEGSPKLFLSKNIFNFICTFGEPLEPQNEMEELITLARKWVDNNHYRVRDLKSFTLECIPKAILRPLSRRQIAQIWNMLKN